MQDLRATIIQFWNDNKPKIISVVIFVVIMIPGVIMPNLRQPESKNSFNTIEFPELTEIPNPLKNKNFIDLGNDFAGNNQDTILPKPSKMPIPVDIIPTTEFNIQPKKDLEKLTPKLDSKIQGKLYLQDAETNGIITDKFPINTSVKIKFDSKSTIATVSQNQPMSTQTIGIVSKKTWSELGVDSSKTKEISVEIEAL